MSTSSAVVVAPGSDTSHEVVATAPGATTTALDAQNDTSRGGHPGSVKTSDGVSTVAAPAS